MNSSVWRDVRSQNGGRSGSRDVIAGLCDGNRIWRVSPDSYVQLKTMENRTMGYRTMEYMEFLMECHGV